MNDCGPALGSRMRVIRHSSIALDRGSLSDPTLDRDRFALTIHCPACSTLSTQ